MKTFLKNLFGIGKTEIPPSQESIDKIKVHEFKTITTPVPKLIETHFDVGKIKPKSVSPTQKRIVKFLLNGNTLSVRNMFKVRVSCLGREISRCFEEPTGIILNRKQINWNENGENGYYFEYSLNNSDYPKLLQYAQNKGIV